MAVTVPTHFYGLTIITPPGSDDQIASEVPYINTGSGLSATNVQTAIDEVSQVASIQSVIITIDYVVLPLIDLVLANHSAPVLITLPAVPLENKIYTIKDKSGNALVNNITVDGNGNNIDGNPTLVMSSNYEAIDFIFDGFVWNVL